MFNIHPTINGCDSGIYASTVPFGVTLEVVAMKFKQSEIFIDKFRSHKQKAPAKTESISK